MKNKLKIGLYRYKDLIEEEQELAFYIIETTLRCLQIKEKNKELILVSSLSVEIDKKVIEIAKKLGMRYDIILPSKPAPSFAHLDDTLYTAFYTTLLESRGYSITKENIEKIIIDTCDVLIQVDVPHHKEKIAKYSIKGKRDYTIIITIKKVDEESVLVDSYGTDNTSGEWAEVDNSLTQQEKFIAITIVFKDIFIEYNSCAKKLGIGHKTMHNWLRKNGKDIQKPFHKAKICELFGLKDSLWNDKFKDEIEFKEALPSYKEEVPLDTNDDEITDIIIGTTINLTAQEEDLINKLSEHKNILYSTLKLDKNTPIYLFELALLLTKKEQIEDALHLLEIIKNTSSSFKYTYYNKIEHQKAILLSHKKMKKYDEAIDILNFLYLANNYHLIEPEIITLLASNYKRKALSELSNNKEWVNRDTIDNSLLTSAMKLYYQSYNRRKDEDKFYDAINLAYLLKLSKILAIDLDDMEENDIEDIELERLYTELTLHWRVNDNDWWQVSSNAEFLMLLGKTDLAILNISDFLESAHDKNNSFDINATLRQLEMYLHFVDDTEGQKFYEYLVESLKGLER